MTRSGAPFHGAHGEGRSAISPAASQAGTEPCARAFTAARAGRNAAVISDNAVVAAPMNWRAESTGKSPSRPATHWAEIMAKVDPAMRISAARKLAQTRLAAPRGITSCGWGASRGTNKSFFLDAPLPSVQTLSALPPWCRGRGEIGPVCWSKRGRRPARMFRA